jgi:putative (di)nucleoside polyphosphate hydrolase
MSVNQYFRAGTGTVIFNQFGEILLFSRTDMPSVWQLQQGGMDAGEEITVTLWRELVEETGLTKDDFKSITNYPKWLCYQYGESARSKIADPNCLGQIHQWYFLELKPETEVNLDNAHDKEFSDYKWTTFSNLLNNTDELKLSVYTELSKFFGSVILPRSAY